MMTHVDDPFDTRLVGVLCFDGGDASMDGFLRCICVGDVSIDVWFFVVAMASGYVKEARWMSIDS